MDDSRPRQPSSEPCPGQFSSGFPGLDIFPQPNLPGTASVLGLQVGLVWAGRLGRKMSQANWAGKGVWGREAWGESCPRQVGLGKVSGARRPGTKAVPGRLGHEAVVPSVN